MQSGREDADSSPFRHEDLRRHRLLALGSRMRGKSGVLQRNLRDEYDGREETETLLCSRQCKRLCMTRLSAWRGEIEGRGGSNWGPTYERREIVVGRLARTDYLVRFLIQIPLYLGVKGEQRKQEGERVRGRLVSSETACQGKRRKVRSNYSESMNVCKHRARLTGICTCCRLQE